MSRDKQTEIANDLNMHCVSLSEQFCGEMSCNACISNWLYNAGYRKYSEVALKVIKEAEQMLTAKIINIEEDFFHGTAAHWDATRRECYEEILVELAELKKKYTEGGV